jgi:phosphohistidine phosphatase
MASVELFLLRHAHAGDPAKATGPDAARPLSARGRDQAERLADHLAALGLAVDALISSPKVRAVETAAPIADRLGLAVRVDERLAGGGLGPASIEAILAHAGDPGVAILVGHDPDMSDQLGELTGLARPQMRKGAVARISIGRPVSPGSGILRWLVPPDSLGG